MTETGIQRPQRNSIRFEEGDLGTLASIDGSTMNDVPYTASRRRSIDAHLRRKILIAYDNSEFSQKMFEWSLAQILRPDNDHILLATVLDVQESTYFHRNWGGDRNAGMKISFKRFRGSARRLSISESDQATAQLKPLVERLVQRGMTAQINVLKGDAKQEIVKLSKDLGADMIIIGSRGLGAVKRLTMGSVSDYCVHNAECPVVVVRETALDMTLNRSMSRRQSQ
ncbi:hypothetical protein INT43_008786 [Umbelopsis isabellina]|uniref:UspA domain-containing protein n=1 Tax=Mortierella isabellina TaxID=91625 RepID=A0A8H7PXD6_MORIS|nr:hypothetical protein INT43_008786 [Umbelopsis isabellina]